MYPGDRPMSDIESQNIDAFFQSLNPQPELAVCLHSYSWLFLYPYGYAYNQYPDNVDEIVSVNKLANLTDLCLS